MKTLDVYGLYGEGWAGEISDQSFAHPAKYSRALIRFIYQHCLSNGYLKPGDFVCDPFGGIGLGARDALLNGIHWQGVELELKFQRLGQGMDCPGFSKEYYRRYNQRGRKWHELNICPDCGALLDKHIPLEHWFGKASRWIPCVEPHRYQGNIERWLQSPASKATATLIQGDSRRLGELVAGAQACVGSPPYIDCPIEGTTGGRMGDGSPGEHWTKKVRTHQSGYGGAPGQLGSMPEGDHADAVVSSPPFGEGETRNRSEHQGGAVSDMMTRAYTQDKQGTTEGNLATLKADTGGYAAAIGSPPFANCEGTKDKEFLRRHYEGIGRNPDGPGAQSGLGGHMVSPDNLGNLPEGNHVDAMVTSPPYIDSVNANDAANDSEARRQRKKDSGLPDTAYHRGGPNSVQNRPQVYGSEDGQLGTMKEGNHADAIVSSPPYADAVKTGEGPGARHDPVHHKGRNAFKKSSDAEYGSTPGNLGNMAACVSSPPFESTEPTRDDNFRYNGKPLGSTGKHYGDTEGNVGNDQGETFWQAAKTIVEQVYTVLKPGGVAVWVTGDFVRNGKRVYFGRQWLQLCEACGFEAIEWIVAWKSEYRGTQLGLFGEHEEKRVDRVSFFRRLANERNPDNAILNEDVIILRKPL